MTTFAEKYAPKYDKAVECLIKDRQTLLTFLDLPADHWDHLRTSNPIESVFATVRHRTVRMKGALSQTPRVHGFKWFARQNGLSSLQLLEARQLCWINSAALWSHGSISH